MDGEALFFLFLDLDLLDLDRRAVTWARVRAKQKGLIA